MSKKLHSWQKYLELTKVDFATSKKQCCNSLWQFVTACNNFVTTDYKKAHLDAGMNDHSKTNLAQVDQVDHAKG